MLKNSRVTEGVFSEEKRLKVVLRRDLGQIKPEAEQLDGKVYRFVRGDKCTKKMYEGEYEWYSVDPTYPRDAPSWIASGELWEVEKERST